MGRFGSPDTFQYNGHNEKNENIQNCKKCNGIINKNTKICPWCKNRIRKFLFAKLLVWAFAFIFLIMFISNLNLDNGKNLNKNKKDSNNDTYVSNNINTITPKPTKGDYIALCEIYPYKKIARNPSDYVGKNATFKGKIIQVQENGNNVILRANITQGEYGMWTDTIYVTYYKQSINEARILEDDIITMYGEIKGLKTYQTVMKSEVTIPWLEMKFYTLSN